MNLTPDDPKLTAYALGELDATERAAVEAALARSPECRRAVTDIRTLGGELTTALAADTATALGALPSREELAAHLSSPSLPGTGGEGRGEEGRPSSMMSMSRFRGQERGSGWDNQAPSRWKRKRNDGTLMKPSSGTP